MKRIMPDRLLDVPNSPLPTSPDQEMLRALIDKVPAQMHEADHILTISD
jgi:hypothetical protein